MMARRFVGLLGIMFVNLRKKRGLSIKNLKVFNISLLDKWKWRCLAYVNAIWRPILVYRYGDIRAKLIGRLSRV